MSLNRLEVISARIDKRYADEEALKKFSQQKIEMSRAPFFFPQGYEYIFLAVYLVTLPYIMGLLFLFLYIAEANSELFASISEKTSYIITWAIGYENLAALFFIFIIKLFIDSTRKEYSRGRSKQKVQKPY